MRVKDAHFLDRFAFMLSCAFIVWRFRHKASLHTKGFLYTVKALSTYLTARLVTERNIQGRGEGDIRGRNEEMQQTSCGLKTFLSAETERRRRKGGNKQRNDPNNMLSPNTDRCLIRSINLTPPFLLEPWTQRESEVDTFIRGEAASWWTLNPVKSAIKPPPFWWLNYHYLFCCGSRGPSCCYRGPGMGTVPSCQLSQPSNVPRAALAPGEHLTSL